MTTRPKVEHASGFVSPAVIHGAIQPPKLCQRYRRWRVWYDHGHYEHGIVYRETKWRAQSPTGELIEHPTGVGDYPWIKQEIDRREDAKAAKHRNAKD